MKNILLLPNLSKDRDLSVTKQTISILKQNGAKIFMDASLGSMLSKESVQFVSTNMISPPDAILVIGGDGSFIDASTLAMQYSAPILGINMGRLGYLSEIDVDHLESLSNLFCGAYSISERMTLCVTLHSGEKSVCCARNAINDVTILHEKSFGISELELFDESGNTVQYRGDGFLLSTPTGSTAYSLSAGGPVIDHSLEAICATPICPHSFFNRSILFAPDMKISVKNISSENLLIHIDGRENYCLAQNDFVSVTKSQAPLRVITFQQGALLRILNKKMKL